MKRHSNQYEKMRQDAETIFRYGLEAVEPAAALKQHCRLEDNLFYAGHRRFDLSKINDIFIVGAGKASAPMAAAMEAILGRRISNGLINVKYGHTTPLKYIEIVEAGHPVPDENGEYGARRMIEIARSAGDKDLVICLISGGGSALLPLPASGLTLQDKQETIKVLIACGASIHEINTIRKHTSAIKGGQLARASSPAGLIAFILSDVVGDDLDVIASGPTVRDDSTFHDCVHILDKYNIQHQLPETVVKHITSGLAQTIAEIPKPDEPIFSHNTNIIIGSNIEAIRASHEKAVALGYHTIILSSMIEGETREVAGVHAAIIKEVQKSGYPVSPPACILSGGETTVTLKGTGVGGRNQEFVLAAAIQIAGWGEMVVLSGGTDGTDGMTDAAGAIADSTTVPRSVAKGIDAVQFLENNDSYHFFKAMGDLLITGPTRTNVMDLRVMLAGDGMSGGKSE